jgi:hypothetical protein
MGKLVSCGPTEYFALLLQWKERARACVGVLMLVSALTAMGLILIAVPR